MDEPKVPNPAGTLSWSLVLANVVVIALPRDAMSLNVRDLLALSLLAIGTGAGALGVVLAIARPQRKLAGPLIGLTLNLLLILFLFLKQFMHLARGYD